MIDLRIKARRVVDLVRDRGSGPADAAMTADLCIADGVVSAGGEVSDTVRLAEIDLSDEVLFPGLINCHDHLQLNGAPELRPPEKYRNSSEWIAWLEAEVGRLKSQPKGAAGLEQPLEVRLWQGALKNALCGAVTVAHHDPHHPILDDSGLPIRVVPCGWAHSPGLEGSYGPGLEESLRATPSTRPWIVHLAEGLDAQAREEFSLLARKGCVSDRTVAVHAVGLDESDRDALLSAGGAGIWCPSSNLSMLGETLDPRPWIRRHGLGVGTDSRLTGAFDLLAELRVAVDAAQLAPADAVAMATNDAARILKLEFAGRLENGAPADFIAIRCGEDPLRDLIAAKRADLRAVVLAGRPVVADPDLKALFSSTDTELVSVRLDGRPKLMSVTALGPAGAAELEPGLEVLE